MRSSRESSGKSLQEVVWATNLVCWAHRQVGESSGRPNRLVRDGRKPGQWGSKGTHVPQNLFGMYS
jgi:hypothetical protein